MKVLAVCLALIYCVHAQISDVPCTGVRIGALTPAFHDVTGVLYVVNKYEFCIANFTYDGLGPDAFLYFYYPGDPISEAGGGVYIPITTQSSNRPQFDLNVPYRTGGGNYRFTLRDNQYRACDFEGFGIWCRYANQLFATITWDNTDIFSAEGAANTIECTPSPGRGYVGMLPAFSNDLGGQLYIKDNKTFAIRDFTYDGQGNDTFVYVFEGVVADGADNNARPGGQGYIIPLAQNNEENGAFDDTVYAAGEADFTIMIPDDMPSLFTCDVATFTIKSRVGTGIFFTRIEVAGGLFTNNRDVSDYRTDLLLCNRTSTRPGYFLGNLPDAVSPAPYSGTVYVQDRNIIFIQLFSYSAELDNVFIYSWPRGQTPQGNGAGGTIINRSATQDKFPMGRSNSFYNGYITIDLRLAQGGPLQTCDIGSFAFIATDTDTILSQMNIPSYAFSEDGEGDTIMCTAGARALASTLTIFGACAIAMIAMLFKA